MCRANTMMVLIFFSVFMLVTQNVKALELSMVEPENCYLIAASPDNEHGGHNATVLDPNNTTMQNQTESQQATSQLLSTEQKQQQPTSFMYLAKFDLQTLPIPASLLFVGIWLIGFKLTSQPPPSLNRA